MSRFIAVDRDTAYLLPPSVNEWLPQDHLARFVVEVIDQLDLNDLVRQYAGRGSARRRAGQHRQRRPRLGACRAFPATPSGRQLGQLRQFKQTPTA